ncbi:MAG: hypothetical protein ACI4AX_09045 [Muribaculaceae bacterium]
MKKHLFLAVALMAIGGVAGAQVQSDGAPVKLLSTPGGLMAPVWSPDGSKIAVTTDNYTGILVANADGKALRQLTREAGTGYNMTWTEDGAAIISRNNIVENGRVFHEIKSFDVKLGTSKVLMAKSRDAVSPRLKARKGAAADIYSAMLARPTKAAKEIKALNQFAGKTVINPALSPDGSKIAFQIPGNGMWLINADGSGLRSLGKGSHASWLPDSKTIVYTVVEDNGERFTSSQLKSVDTSNGKTSVITRRADMIPMTPSVSPDGRKVAFENAADAAIYVVNIK